MNPVDEFFHKVLEEVKTGSSQISTDLNFETLFQRFVSEHPLEDWEWFGLLQYAGEFVMKRERQGAAPKP